MKIIFTETINNLKCIAITVKEAIILFITFTEATSDLYN